MAITLVRSAARRTRRRPPARGGDPRQAQAPSEVHLRLMTLNVAHARREGRHQALLASPRLRHNLSAIAKVIGRESPDVVALQEADGPSAWSGDFDHVATLAELAGYPHTFRGEHNPFSFGRYDLSSGTALLARLPLSEPRSLSFTESWRDTKGFVAATVAPEAFGGIAVDVVSIHLDFLADRVRRRQVERLVEAFRQRERPLVVMGDFNCEWSERRRSLDLLRQELKLRPVESTGNATFPSWRPLIRLDWILVTEELEFTAYETLPDRLSDHLGVVAEIQPRGAAAIEPEPEPEPQPEPPRRAKPVRKRRLRRKPA